MTDTQDFTTMDVQVELEEDSWTFGESIMRSLEAEGITIFDVFNPQTNRLLPYLTINIAQLTMQCLSCHRCCSISITAFSRNTSKKTSLPDEACRCSSRHSTCRNNLPY